MKITNITNPTWANAEHTIVNATVTHSEFGIISFSASPDDVEAHGREIFADAVAGKFGPIGEYVPLVIVVPVPQAVTRYQGRATLLQMGLLDDIDAHYAALPTDTADEAVNLANRMAKERWAGMLNFERDSVELAELATAFSLSSAQVDDLFCFAATIK